jgi:hypothetical protein
VWSLVLYGSLSRVLLVAAFVPLWIPWLIGLSCVSRTVVVSSHNLVTTMPSTPIPVMLRVSVCLDIYVYLVNANSIILRNT